VYSCPYGNKTPIEIVSSKRIVFIEPENYKANLSNEVIRVQLLKPFIENTDHDHD